MNKPENNRPSGMGYETHDLNVRVIVVVALIAIVILGSALYFIDQLFQISKEKRIEDVVLKPVSVPLRELHSQEDEVLSSYKIIDAQNGVYQIPIERAMEILANQAYQNNTIQKSPTGNRITP
jgi:hypothetical protein